MNTAWIEIAAWAAQGEQGTPGGSFTPIIMMFAVIFTLYVFLIKRPGDRDKRKRQELMDSMAKGDAVITAGGIHGKLESVNKDDDTVLVMVAPKVPMKFNRASIVTVRPKGAPKEENGKAEDGKKR